MLHQYPQYPDRMIHVLSGFWDFCFSEDADLQDPDWDKLVFSESAAVPGVFDMLPGSAGRRGIGFYRTVIKTRENDLLLHIGALGLAGTIWFDRKKIGYDDLPYSPVSYEIHAEAGEHELIIAADNRPETSILFHQNYDFFGFGGIYRSCELHEFSMFSFRRAKISTCDLQGGIRVELSFLGKVTRQLPLSIAIDGQEVVAEKIYPVKNGRIVLVLQVPQPAALWSPESPVLHTVTFRSGKKALIERFGLRIIEAKDGKILLNGKELVLHGVCRHETHPEFGSALPAQVLLEDLALLKDLGCNFIRGTHYPQDPRFLDLCDESGLLIWEEGIGWGDPVERLQNPVFQDAQTRQFAASIEESFNHPCIILRGFLNEGASNLEASYPCYKLIADEIRRMDPTRLVTYASMYAEYDCCLELADVVSFNLYPGWYAKDKQTLRPLKEIRQRLRRLLQWKKKSRFHDKPLILSEIGAGAIYGWRDRLHAHWSEEYQADYLNEVCSFADRNRTEINGLAIWQFCDGRTYSSSMALNRPRAFNNKGIVDEYRRPKLAYDIVKLFFKRKNKGKKHERNKTGGANN